MQINTQMNFAYFMNMRGTLRHRNATMFFGMMMALFFVMYAPQAFAGSEHSVRGWMWGGSESGDGTSGVIDGDETGVGWISMNSLNCDDDENGQSDGASGCPSSGTTVADYGVDIPDEDGVLFGYGWSENLGWVTFNADDLDGCPTGTCNARRESVSELAGWARILSIDEAGSNAGGYEGWIKLGSNPSDPVSYGGTISGAGPADVTGYAWSDEFGWIRFEDVQYANVNANVAVCAPSAIVTQGGSFQLTAWYDAGGSVLTCGDLTSAIDVTTSASWTSDVTGTVVVDDDGSKGLVTGVIEGGPIAVRASYSGGEGQSLIRVNNVVNANCGNGAIDALEACDDGAAGNGSCGDNKTCSPYCVLNICARQCSV